MQEDLAGGPAVAPLYQHPRQGREAPSEAREPLTGVLTSGAMAGPQVRDGHRKRTAPWSWGLTSVPCETGVRYSQCVRDHKATGGSSAKVRSSN